MILIFSFQKIFLRATPSIRQTVLALERLANAPREMVFFTHFIFFTIFVIGSKFLKENTYRNESSINVMSNQVSFKVVGILVYKKIENFEVVYFLDNWFLCPINKK